MGTQPHDIHYWRGVEFSDKTQIARFLGLYGLLQYDPGLEVCMKVLAIFLSFSKSTISNWAPIAQDINDLVQRGQD